MGCRVDLTFPAYRKYRLELLAEQMQKGILTEMYSFHSVFSTGLTLAVSVDRTLRVVVAQYVLGKTQFSALLR